MPLRPVFRVIRRLLLDTRGWPRVVVVALVVMVTAQVTLAAASAESQSSSSPQVSSVSQPGSQGQPARIRAKRHVDVRSLPQPQRGARREAKPSLPAPRLAPAQPGQPSRPVTTTGLAAKAGPGAAHSTQSGHAGTQTATSPESGPPT